MSQMMFSSMSMMNSVLFSKMKHPMSMGASLLVQTVLICMITGTMAQNLWFSYILFLVFLGGMMVLFIYMTSVASNELFQKSSNMMMMMTVLTIIVVTAMMCLTNEMMTTFNTTMETITMDNHSKESDMTMNLFNYPNNMMTLFAVIYLFVTLIVVVSITESHSGPLRSKY